MCDNRGVNTYKFYVKKSEGLSPEQKFSAVQKSRPNIGIPQVKGSKLITRRKVEDLKQEEENENKMVLGTILF